LCIQTPLSRRVTSANRVAERADLTVTQQFRERSFEPRKLELISFLQQSLGNDVPAIEHQFGIGAHQ
jgi:hypothetical protein